RRSELRLQYRYAVAFQMSPNEVLERFTEEELVHLVAYENLYGTLGPERFDVLFARLGMDVTAPHTKKGKKPKFEDHIIPWGGKQKRKQTPEEMLAKAKEAHSALTSRHRSAQAEHQAAKERAEANRRRRQRTQRGNADGHAGRVDGQDRRGRSGPGSGTRRRRGNRRS